MSPVPLQICSPILSILLKRDVKTNEPALTTSEYSESMIYGFTLAIAHSLSLDKQVMTCIHHYSITHDGFTGLKILYPIYS